MRRSGQRGDRDSAGWRSSKHKTTGSLFRRKRGAGGGDGGWRRRRRRAADDGRRSRHSSGSRSSRSELRTFVASSPLEGASPFQASSPFEESSPLAGASPFVAEPRSARRRGLWGLKDRKKSRNDTPAGPAKRKKKRGFGLLAVAGTLGAAMGYGATGSDRYSVHDRGVTGSPPQPPAGPPQSPSERTAQFVSAGGLLSPPPPVSGAGSGRRSPAVSSGGHGEPPFPVRRSWSVGGGQPSRPSERRRGHTASWPPGGCRAPSSAAIFTCRPCRRRRLFSSHLSLRLFALYAPRAAAFVWGDGRQSGADGGGGLTGTGGGPGRCD